jgi:hypothetical protein
MIDPAEYMKQLNSDRMIAEEVIDFIQEKCDNDLDSGRVVAAIAYCAISVASEENIHAAINRLMTIHKNTELVKGEDQ